MTEEIVYTPAEGDSLRLVEIDVDNHLEILRLKVADGQGKFVAGNAVSMVQGHYHDTAWFRAVYLDDDPVGFVMLYDPRRETTAAAPGRDGFNPGGEVPDDGLFIWRLMVDRTHQGKGIGRRLIALLAELAKANGFRRLLLSYVDADGGPGAFYARCGFAKTGRFIDGEVEACLDLD